MGVSFKTVEFGETLLKTKVSRMKGTVSKFYFNIKRI